ncbi:MAG: ABC1 kinase family protein [Syntrophomonadaceae bacterium]|jgi:predicted unusual protein kinase regulating ubiquinone biosynthesis (AarF/ABC1/UbiB family)
MQYNSWVGLKRFLSVIYLFLHIFWSFYSLKIKGLWHEAGWKEKRRQELYVSEARRFRNTAVEMGGLLIKLGQFFSTRVDVFPQSVTRELAGLQDEVPPVDYKDICKVLESEFGQPLETIFPELEADVLASASLGQVHRARLPGGEVVAVKILRPGIEKLIAIDLRAIQKVITCLKIFTDWEKWVDFDAIYKEFADTLWEEVNYLQEGRNAETIARNNVQNSELSVPRIYWEYTRSRVLTMEFVDGLKITDYEELEKAGINRSKLAEQLLEIYIKQILVDGFFHADPHPGNLFISPAGKVIMIDFGMVGVITPDLRDTLIKLVLAMVGREDMQVVHYLKQVGFLRMDANNELVARAIGVFMEQFLGTGAGSFELGALLEDLEELLYEQPFQIPARFTFMGRALGTLYGLCVGLDPKISFLDAAKPYLKDFMPEEASPWGIIKEKGKVLGSSLIEVPPLAEKVLRRMDRGDLELRLPLRKLEEAMEQNIQASYAIAWGIAFGFTLLTSVYLYVQQFINEAKWGLAVTALFFLIFLGKSRSRGGRRVLRHPEGINKARHGK